MPDADFPLENLILAETNQSRTSPLREAGGTLHEIALVEKYVEKTTINS